LRCFSVSADLPEKLNWGQIGESNSSKSLLPLMSVGCNSHTGQPTETAYSYIPVKHLEANDFASLSEVEERLLGFLERYQEAARPFEWKLTRADLSRFNL
jgi:hypothetical protein